MSSGMLVVPWLALRALRGPRPGPEPWQSRVDLPLALGTGAAVALLCGLWLARFALGGATAAASPDFLEYCWSTAAAAAGTLDDVSRNRSLLAAAPSAVIGRQHGVLNGLLASAVLSTGLLASAVWLWARALHSRGAGMLAALAVGAVWPLCVLSRTLTYYPPIIALLALCAAGGAVALRWRTAAACAVAGTAAGLALLVDLRGLPWALCTVGLGALAALWGPGRPRRGRRRRGGGGLLRLGALALPLWLSFQAGPAAYLPGTRTLEDQMHTLLDLRKMGISVTRTVPRPRSDAGFVWGRSDLRGLPATLRFVAAEGQLVPPALREALHVVDHRRARVDPWLPVALGALAAALVGLRRRPAALLAAAGTALPFVLALDNAIVVKQSHPRFLANALPFLPVLLGVGAASLAGLEGRPRRSLAATLLGLLLVLGVLPSMLSPTADWRRDLQTTQAELDRARAAAAGTAAPRNVAARACAEGIRRVAGDGGWLDALP